MQLTGKHVVDAPPEKVWDMLMNTETLARIVPGISRLEKTGDNTFKSLLEIKLGPVSGSFTGNLQLEEITDQKEFTIKVQQNSKIGNANAAIKIDLLQVDTVRTEIAFNGDVKMTGLLANMGQRVMGGAANSLSKQFFANFEKELKSQSPAVSS